MEQSLTNKNQVRSATGLFESISKAFEPRDLEIYAFCIYLGLSFHIKKKDHIM